MLPQLSLHTDIEVLAWKPLGLRVPGSENRVSDHFHTPRNLHKFKVKVVFHSSHGVNEAKESANINGKFTWVVFIPFFIYN